MSGRIALFSALGLGLLTAGCGREAPNEADPNLSSRQIEIVAKKGTVTDLVAGSGISFADRGVHTLKGVPGEWQLYAVSY